MFGDVDKDVHVSIVVPGYDDVARLLLRRPRQTDTSQPVLDGSSPGGYHYILAPVQWGRRGKLALFTCVKGAGMVMPFFQDGR